ncbi:MAG: FkbM family methyltransferase [Pseudomonadota bacterium]
MSSLKGRLVQRLREHPVLYKKLRLIWRRITQGPQSLKGMIRQRLKGLPTVFFVQIGSNDGNHGDPISGFIRRERRFSGIFVEPVPEIFKRLKLSYGPDPRFVYENVLIGSSTEPVNFYYVSERAKQELGDAVPYWYDQLGSFDKQHIAKHLDGLLVPYIIEARLPSVPLPTLLARNAVQHIDLLHIDTEGYDYEVLTQFDFDRYRPAVVLYEHKHLTPELRSKAQALLKAYGYVLRPRVDDTLALQPR